MARHLIVLVLGFLFGEICHAQSLATWKYAAVLLIRQSGEKVKPYWSRTREPRMRLASRQPMEWSW